MKLTHHKYWYSNKNSIDISLKLYPLYILYQFKLYLLYIVQVKVFINGELKEKFKSLKSSEFSETVNQKTISNDKKTETLPDGNFTFRLEELAYTRSGDKGNTANIGKH